MAENKKSRQRHCGHRLPTLVEHVQSILQKYPDGGQILKELIQNADDAGATEVSFLFDERNHGVTSLETPDLAPFQGPALYCHNNATFKERDWEGIRNLMKSNKKEDPLKIGRFGIGFNSVYHITDLPGIASGDTIAFLDPHEEYFRNEKGRGSSVTLYYFDEDLLEGKTRDQFMPFQDVFGCDLKDSEKYEGTLFRFPLRTKASELSKEGYSEEKVLKLFDSLQTEASVVLLFLKNICSISLHKRFKNGETECSFKVEISEESRDEVMKRRQEFLSKATEKTEISDSRYVMNVKVMKGSTTHEYRWLVVNQIGSNVSRISELATKENLPPWIGMALPLGNESNRMFDGRIFCFLPLPPDVDCETGLPVHVHGAFALTDNRRGLVWPGADNQSSTAEWNKLLLTNVAVEVYSKLLHVLLQNSPSIGVDERSRSQLVYSTLPCKAKVKGHWQVILDPLFQKLSKEEWRLFLAQHASGDSWVRLQDAVVDRLVDSHMHETVLKALLNCSETVITSIPSHVLNIVENHFPASRDITPGLMRSVLKRQHDLKASREDKIELLEYILEDDPSDDLAGIPLLPLANKEFTTFMSNTHVARPSSSVFIATATCPISVLPNFDHRFLSEDVPTTVKDKLHTLGSENLQSENTTQLVLINKGIVLQNLRSCLPAEWFNNGNSVVQWMPGKSSHPSESWIEMIWSWINSNFQNSLEPFDGLPLIQLPAPFGMTYTQLGVLWRQSCFIFASDVSGNSLPNVVVKLLTASGCTIVPCQSSNLKHSDINRYIAPATPTGVITVLSRTSLGKAQEFLKFCSSDERYQLREFLSRLPKSLDFSQSNLLLHLPLFNTLDGTCTAIQTENRTLPVAESKFIVPNDFKFRRSNQIISSDDTSSQQLLHLLDKTTLNSAEVLLKFLFPDIAARNVYGLDETAKIMLWIITRVFDFKMQCERFIEEMKHLPFVPTNEGVRVKPSELYDPSDDTLKNLFHGEAKKFPRNDFHTVRVVSILRDEMGLRTIDKITANELLEVAMCISSSSKSSSSCKLQALVKILNDTPEFLNQSVNMGVTLKSELLRVKWLPRATTSHMVCPRFPPSITWYACDADYFAPPDLCDKSYALILGSTMPVLDIDLNERVRRELGFTADPPLKHVVAQLKMAITVWSGMKERKAGALFKEMFVAVYNQLTSCPKETVLFKEMIVAIYTQLARCPKETVFAHLNDVSAEHWIWHGDGFCSPSKISFKMDIPFDLRPQLFLLPDELRDDAKLEQFFLESGVRAKFSEDDIISVLPALKQKHETLNGDTAEVEKDLKLCRSILEWFQGKELSENMEKNLLFPVENEENILVLQHYKDCAYCDADWLRREESMLDHSYPMIHNSVPTKIAISLGVPKLSSCLLSAETLDFDLGIEKSGPSEPITTRIRNILEDYKEGVGVFKELIQNADDAGASKVRFLVDWRVGPKDKLLADGMSECQGPALWAYNDGVFSDSDFENINKLAGATKKQNISTIGRFGLGFNAVYHVTDVPSFLSREYIVMFDPNCHHLQNHIKDASQPGIRINLAKFPKPLKVFENQFQPYHGIFDCDMKYNAQKPFHYQGTLFRFPFRTLVQAGKSDICQKVYDEEKVKTIVDSLTESASLLLVYTEHVTVVELFELKSNESPEHMRPILSVRKTTDSPDNGTPFIKTCSEWWSEKMRDGASLGECPSKSQCITINITKSTTSSSGDIKNSKLQESWLVNSCMGKGSSSTLALSSEGQEKGLMPFAETAAKINCEENTAKIPEGVSGEAFCFLPLSIPTGLPVHINGYFALMSNRRAIWEPGTIEHDKPFESNWNESLLSDAIACSYAHLLLEIKSKLPTNATNLQAMLPSYDTLHSTTWEPLVKTIYNKIVNESLAIFWCNEQWLNIHSGFILDDDLRNAPGVILTMNSLGKNVLDLTEDVCKSFKKAGHEDTIQSRTLTLQRFFQELFFPNISRIAHELREPLVCFGLDCILKGHEELKRLFKNNKSILSDDGQLKKPSELFDPYDSQLQGLFFQEAGKFPHQDFVDNNSSLFSVLKKLGLRSKEMIMPEELLNVAKTISLSEFSDLLIKKSEALVNLLQSQEQYLSQDINGCGTLKQELQDVKWLPRSRTPPKNCRYPEKMPWLDVEDAFFSPAELCGKSQALLIGSCMPVVDIIPENLLVEFGVISELPLENVVAQLSKAVQMWCTDPHMKSTSQFQDLLQAIYQHLAGVSEDTLSRALTQADLKHWIWHGDGFCSPSQISFKMDIPFDLRPQLFLLPDELRDDAKLEQFFLESGVRTEFSEDDIISVLPALKQKHETLNVDAAEVEKDLKLCRSILEWFQGKELSENMEKNLLFPVENEENILVLQHYKDCAYCDADWLRREESMLDSTDSYPLIHNSVPTKIAISLGVPKLSSCLLSAETLDFDLGIEKSGPSEPITTRIRNILEDYKEGVGVFKELIQNADDAGASKVRFLVDWRVGPKDKLLADGMSECQGPALWAYNDGVFSDSDFENINKLAGATKKQNISTIGRFGLGFNAVYHLTDVPSFLSREYIVMFDPNCHHLQNHIKDASQPGIRINLAKFPKPLKVFENQFQPYHGIFDCDMKYNAQEPFHYQGTLFRFPFRTLVQAGKSDICQKVYDEEKVKTIVDSLTESASLLLVYTEHVTVVELFELKSNESPEHMRPILSVRKTTDSPDNGTPFIKTCSEWWSEKMREGASLGECPSKSQCITINITKSTTSSSGDIKNSKLQESWLVNSCMGKGSSSTLALSSEGREKGLMPFAETAAKINCEETAAKIPEGVSGEAFCFLPLSIPTGLPVHVNGYFAIMSNRRAIWEPGTTEHDKPFEGDWNESLLSDAIACSYAHLLLEIKSKLPTNATNLQAMLPYYDTLHSTTWEPLVKSIYNKIVDESLAIFWCNEQWLDIHSGFILDDDLCNAPGVISTMNSLGKNVLDLTKDVCKSFEKAGHEDTIQNRTLTLQRFFQELFFPNISRIAHELREPLVCFGLDCILKGHEELERLFKDNESILSDDGQLKKPSELFDPYDSQLLDLFFQETGKFPHQDFVDDSLLSVLKKLGLRSKDMIMPEELLHVAKTISLSDFSDLLIKKSQALVNLLQSQPQYFLQAVNRCSTLKQELQDIKWLPRSRTPPKNCRYPEKMPWLDVEDAFFSPAELRGIPQALLIGSCMPVVDIIPENLLVEFGVISELPLEHVITQLSNAVQMWCTDPHMKFTSQFQDLLQAIYQHLAGVSEDTLSRALTQADLKNWIWHGTGFASPAKVAIERFVMDLHPHLFYLPDHLHQDEAQREFFISNGLRRKFSKQDIVSVLSSMKEKHESDSSKTAKEIEHDLKLCRFIVEWLVESDDELSTDLQEKVLVPIETSDKSLVLKPCSDCTYCDHEWLRQGGSELNIPEELFLVDELISEKVARLLGVKPLSTCLMSGEELDFELTGQNEPLTTRLKNILSEYKQGVGVFKELIQNADDAGATKVCFLIDWREGPMKSLFSPSMSECQGPALWAYNDAVFSDYDFKNINKLAGKTKIEDFEKIGRFGLGFNAVYHLTDVPSFLSRQYLVIFDPNIQHLKGKVTDAHPGVRIDLAKNPRPLKTFFDQFQPYHDVFQCSTSPQSEERYNFNGTLFRFPFRTKLQASRSKISEEVYNVEKVEALISSLRECLSHLLLFTQRVNEVEVYELDKNQNPRCMRLIVSTKKSVESVNLELNPILRQDRPKSSFIKECSEWWKTKLSEDAVLPGPSRSEIVTIEVKEQEAETVKGRKEQWLVSSCMGADSSLQLAMNEGQKDGLLPCAGTAAKLSSDTTPCPEPILGEAFCFLPLSFATGLPIHINSSFAVAKNRRSIWRRSTTQHQDLEVRWNESLMSDPLCNAYIQLLENMKCLCEKDVLRDYPFHELWPRKLSDSWETLVKSIYTKLVENSLQLLRSNDSWLDIHSGYILADDLRKAPNVIETMQCLKENVYELPEDVCDMLKKCGQEETLEERTLTVERFFSIFFFPNVHELPHELRNPLVQFGLDCISAKNEELESLFINNPCIPCSQDRKTLVKPSELINPNGAAAELFSPEDNRFPVGDEFLTEIRVFVLEKLGMQKDLLPWEEIYERAKTVEIIAKTCYEKALLRSRKLIEYLNQQINKLPTIEDDKTLQDICFLPFIKELQDYKNGLPWKGRERKREQFCSPNELFVPHYMDLVGSCCLILSTHDVLGCGKLERKVKDFLGISHRHPSNQQVLEQLDNIIKVWSTFKKDDRIKNCAKMLKICHCVYESLNKYLAKMANTKDRKITKDEEMKDTKEKGDGEKMKDDEEKREGEEIIDDEGTQDVEEMKEPVKELLDELAKRKWLFIVDTFVFNDQAARYWCRNGAPYLYGVPTEYNAKYKILLQMTNVKEKFDTKDFLNAINSLKVSKECTPLSDAELDVAVTFLNELLTVDDQFCKENADHFCLPDKSKVLVKADLLTINNTPWLPERGDSRSVHENITPYLAFKLGAKSLLDKRLGKYSRTLGTPFGQQEKLTDRLKGILKSYPCDSGIVKELVQNADDAQATEIHFIYDQRTLPCKQVFYENAEEIHGPALCVYNNQAFSESDFVGIQKLGIGSKSENAEKTGQFGIGFNAVYHLTDCPSFISNGETLCILDPHCRYAPNASCEHPGGRFDPIDQEFRDDFVDVMNGYLEDFGFNLQGSTMFRLPLRSLERSRHSQISNRTAVYMISSLMDEFKSEAKRSMLFLNHIKKVSISVIDSTGKLETKYEVRSNVDGEDLEKLKTLLSHKKTFKNEQTKNIPWHGVTFPLVLSDTDKCVEHWLVHQCFGVNASDESEVNDESKVNPESEVNDDNEVIDDNRVESGGIPDGREYKLLPHGGLAALVESNKKVYIESPRYFAYCFLPLPVRTPLPVHINGHFALDNGRRGLWNDLDSKNPLELWNTMIKKNVLAPGYASLILEAQKYMRFSEREGEDKASCFFPGKESAEAGLSWYHNLFPGVLDKSWSPLTLTLYAFLAKTMKPVLPVVIADEPNDNERPDDMPRRIQRWLPLQDVLFVNNYIIPENLKVTDNLMKILLEIQLPVVEHSPVSVQQGFEKAGCVVRVVSPDSVMLALRDFSSSNAECKIGTLPCNIEETTIGNESKLRKLITYCEKGEKFYEYLPGLPLLLTADVVLRVFSEEEKAYCSTFCDLFPKQANKFVHPEIVTYLSSVLDINKRSKIASEKPSNDSASDSTVSPSLPTVLLPLTADVVDTFMSDIFPQHTKDAEVHFDFDVTGVSEEWLKRLWVYLQTYSKKVDNSKAPLDALKSWPIIPTKSKKLVTVKMAKTVLDMTIVGNESNAALNVSKSLEKLNCPCLDTHITLPKKESRQSAIGSFISTLSSAFTQQPTFKEEPAIAVTKPYVAHPYSVPDVLDVFDFMLRTDSINASALSDSDIMEILQFIQDGYEKLDAKEKYNKILKQLPFYKSINGKHYKLSDFFNYAVIPAGVPAEEIDELQERTHCLFLHSDMLQSLEKLLTGLDAGAKSSNAEFYKNYILPNFAIFSPKMKLHHLIHIRDKVIHELNKDSQEAKDDFLNSLKGTRCIPNKNGDYVHASEFYDPRKKVFRIMEDESSNKFPPPPFNEEEWLDFLVLIGMINNVDETLFKKFASRVAVKGNTSPDDEANRQRSKVLLSYLFTNHHLHDPEILYDLSTIKFIATQKVEDTYLSLYEQHCCTKSSEYPPFVQFSNAVLWKYRSLVWTSTSLLPEWDVNAFICNQHWHCKIEDIYKHLEVKYPSPEMVVSHLQNISGVLAERSNKEQKLPQIEILTITMNDIYEFLQKATKCPKPEISAECSHTCAMIGNRLASFQCILVPANNPDAVVKGDQLSFRISKDKSLVPFIYQVPWEYGNLQHLLKRLGATESITPLQLVSVFKKMKDRTRDNEMNLEIRAKAHNAMFLLFESLLKETEKTGGKSPIASVRELFLPSVDKRLIKSNELLCKIPPRHNETIKRLQHRALCLFETCGLERDLESKYLSALPDVLRPKPFQAVVKERLDESCLEKTCQLCNKNNDDCEFIKKLKVLLKSEQFKNGIIRVLKHQKKSNKLSDKDEEVASRLFLNKVEFKCMEIVFIHLLHVDTDEILEGSSTPRKCFVVEDFNNAAWTLYVQHGEMPSSLVKSINKILDWKIKDDLLLAVAGMLDCSLPLEIPGVLNDLDIEVDGGKNEDVKLGSEVPGVFHQLLQQNLSFVLHPEERVAYCVELPDEADVDGVSKYILVKIIRCVTSNSSKEKNDLEARYLVDIGGKEIEVSVLDLYKFYEKYPDENACKDLVPFTGDVDRKPKSYDEAKREILEALRAAWRLPLVLRRKAIHRLYLRWHPDKNPDNPKFAAEMMIFLKEQIERMENEEQGLTKNPENFNFTEIFKQCNRQASRDRATFYNYQRYCPSFPTSSPAAGHRPSSGFHFDSATFHSAESYTTPNPREARRWVEQAEGDLSVCQYLERKPFDAMACFTSQQIVEKCLKAALYYECGLTNEQLHTHDIYSLVTCVNNLKRWKNDEVVRLSLAVADYYLPTRYPNRLSYPKVPHSSFDGQSCDAMSSAAEVLRLVKVFMSN